MIRPGDTITNPITGESVTFLRTAAQTNGRYVLIETTVAPDGAVAAAHVHPQQTERFEILSGHVEFMRDGEVIRATAGDVVDVAAGEAHSFRNIGSRDVRFRTLVSPALEFETFLETMFGLAADGKTNQQGLPNPFRLAVIMERHFNLVNLPLIPASLQHFGLKLGAPVGKLFGYTSSYRRVTVASPAVEELELAA